MAEQGANIKVERTPVSVNVAAMPLVLVISSYVAASRVGGSLAPFVLGPMKVDPIHVPTCLFGRHPGWGPPGGSAVDPEVMAKLLEGVEANGLYSMVDAVITGHFSLPEQVAVAAEATARIRAAPRMKPHAHAPPQPIVIVDPIMGDEGPGLYIKPQVAERIITDLIPKADLVAPNLWEFAKLTGASGLGSAEDVAAAARRHGGHWLISSIPTLGGIGAVHVADGTAMLAETQRIGGSIPNGTGDLLTLRFAGGLVCGLDPGRALADAVGATHMVIAKTMEWGGKELALAACSDLLASMQQSALRKIS